jgi:2-polyprenyl-3-methyl-5-hydroxy-6-metoxy-1,4-benzoquinol methylase
VTDPSCAICGGSLAFAFSATDRNRRLSEERFDYRRCLGCRTLALAPVPANLARYYPPEYYSLPSGRDALIAAAGRERYKVEILRGFVPTGRLVEIGPAIGGFCALAQDAGYETSAIEMDSACCRFLRTVVGIDVDETSEPIGSLATRGPFDVVAMWQVIEHLPNPREVLAAAAGSLAPGGIIVIGTPNPAAFQFRLFGPRWTHLDAPRHLFLIPAPTLARAGAELGLESALLTTHDAGTLGWNSFGWRESLAGFARGRYARHGLRLVGSAAAAFARPLDRYARRGTTYTLVLRRPAI